MRECEQARAPPAVGRSCAARPRFHDIARKEAVLIPASSRVTIRGDHPLLLPWRIAGARRYSAEIGLTQALGRDSVPSVWNPNCVVQRR